MIAIADWLARRLWYAMLWLMRRPWMRRLQRRSFSLFGEERRALAYAKHKRQERFARRYGLPLVRLVILVFLLSMTFTLVYRAVLYAYEQDWIPRLDPLRRRG